MYVCRNFDEDSGYRAQSVRGEWVGDTAGGCKNHNATHHKNPQFLLRVQQPTHIYLELSQGTLLKSTRDNASIYLIMCLLACWRRR